MRQKILGMLTSLAAVAGFTAVITVAAPIAPANAGCMTYPCASYYPDAVAHRGDREFYDDNSWAAIDSAIAKGADWVEIDVHYNDDTGRVVLFHDSWCGGEQVESMHPASIGACSGKPVIFLDDVLDHFADVVGYRGWMIELKSACSNPLNSCSSAHPRVNLLTEAVANLLHEHGLTTSSWVTSLDDYLLMRMGQKQSVLTGQRSKLMKTRPYDASWLNNVSSGYMNNVKDMGFDAVNVNIRSTSDNSVDYAHSIGLLFSTWDLSATGEETDKAIDIEADFHMTDRLNDMLEKTSGSGGGGGGTIPGPDCSRYARTCW